MHMFLTFHHITMNWNSTLVVNCGYFIYIKCEKDETKISCNHHNIMQKLNNLPTNIIIPMLGWVFRQLQEEKHKLHLFILLHRPTSKKRKGKWMQIKKVFSFYLLNNTYNYVLHHKIPLARHIQKFIEHMLICFQKIILLYYDIYNLVAFLKPSCF
jgi:hypothetical protein